MLLSDESALERLCDKSYDSNMVVDSAVKAISVFGASLYVFSGFPLSQVPFVASLPVFSHSSLTDMSFSRYSSVPKYFRGVFTHYPDILHRIFGREVFPFDDFSGKGLVIVNGAKVVDVSASILGRSSGYDIESDFGYSYTVAKGIPGILFDVSLTCEYKGRIFGIERAFGDINSASSFEDIDSFVQNKICKLKDSPILYVGDFQKKYVLGPALTDDS